MEDKLKRMMVQFCRRFGLRYGSLKFSRELTEKELNAYNLLLSGRLSGEILRQYGNDYAEADRRVGRCLSGTSFTGNIDRSGKEKIAAVITAAKHGRSGNVAKYLRHNTELLGLLSGTYRKIDDRLINTIPIPRPEGALDVLRARLFYRETLSVMVHECIHNVLQYNGIDYSKAGGKDMRDEGLCQYLHRRFGKNYHSDPEYERYAAFFERLFRNVPDVEIIPALRKYPAGKLLKDMKKWRTK
jgi:hypothetical protein